MPRGVTPRCILCRSSRELAKVFNMTTAKKRVHLSIDEKIEVIRYAADHPRIGVRAMGQLHVRMKEFNHPLMTLTSYPDCPSAQAFVLCMYGAAWGML